MPHLSSVEVVEVEEGLPGRVVELKKAGAVEVESLGVR
jgi:hypothetical protein